MSYSYMNPLFLLLILHLFFLHLNLSAFGIGRDQFVYSGFTSANLTLDGAATITPNGLLELTNGTVRIKGHVRNVEYSTLPVMSELSTVQCDRALGLWIAGTRASCVDGELPWRSSGRVAAVASTPGSRTQAATECGFLGLCHKTKEADGG